MSFKLFVYYCALCGGWAGFVSWAFSGVLSGISNDVLQQALRASILGLFLAAAIAAVDALLNDKMVRGFVRVGVAVGVSLIGALLVGMVGQLILHTVGGMVGDSQIMYMLVNNLDIILTWVVVGVIIGASIGLFDIGLSFIGQQRLMFSISKLFKGCGGGAVGGFVGGCFYALCQSFDSLKHSGPATGFVILGLCIGLLIGLAQIILKEAWLRVEQGFRPGRELMLVKAETSIGRAEACDLGLFGDNGVERQHARIVMNDGRYFLYDEGTPGGTFVNDQRINGPTPLRSGDLIRVGRNVIVFGERQKRPA